MWHDTALSQNSKDFKGKNHKIPYYLWVLYHIFPKMIGASRDGLSIDDDVLIEGVIDEGGRESTLLVGYVDVFEGEIF